MYAIAFFRVMAGWVKKRELHSCVGAKSHVRSHKFMWETSGAVHPPLFDFRTSGLQDCGTAGLPVFTGGLQDFRTDFRTSSVRNFRISGLQDFTIAIAIITIFTLIITIITIYTTIITIILIITSPLP